jgi:CYTH domain-containing protein
MAIEIERKFLITAPYKSFASKHTYYRQGYISTDPGCSIRIRIAGDNGYITIKGPGNDTGISHFEWEKEIPVKEAEELFQFCHAGIIEKIRYLIPYENHLFEVDEFLGANQGLTVAEIELKSEDEVFSEPPWLGKEVTGIRRYYNSNLSKNPYSTWAKELQE